MWGFLKYKFCDLIKKKFYLRKIRNFKDLILIKCGVFLNTKVLCKKFYLRKEIKFKRYKNLKLGIFNFDLKVYE